MLSPTLLVVHGAILLRALLSLHPHSGQGMGPIFGDYEAQRHWQEITVNIPMKDWYFNTTDNDLQYWGLDYPPLTAYHSYLIGRVAQRVDPAFVALKESRGMESYEHRIFMRLSVMVSDLVVLIPAVVFLANAGPRPSIVAAASLLYPGLILIDHGHFQYNGVSLGFTLLAIGLLTRAHAVTPRHDGHAMNRHVIAASASFCLALSYKQMELYHALPFFFYLLGLSWRGSGSWVEAVGKVAAIGGTVVITFAVVWAPFIKDLTVAQQVLHRIFPFARGIFEDKVANFWCSLNVVVKIKNLVPLQSMALISLVTTAVLCLPSNIHLFFKPTMDNFKMTLLNTSLIFFLFSYQVHEKSILLVAMPAAAVMGNVGTNRRYTHLTLTWFLLLSTLSMFPLLSRDRLTLPTLTLTLLFTLITKSFGLLSPLEESSAAQRVKPIHTRSWADLLVSAAFVISLTVCAVLCAAHEFVLPPKDLPHLWPLLISVYCAGHFVLFGLYFHYVQFSSPKIKKA